MYLAGGDAGELLCHQLAAYGGHEVGEEFAFEMAELVLYHAGCEVVEVFRELFELFVVVLHLDALWIDISKTALGYSIKNLCRIG